MDATRGKGEAREVKFGFVRRVHDGPVGIGDADGCAGETFVDDIGGDGAEVSGAAAIGNGT